ncbi:DUF3265 domain-containing protein [Vibrio parahaemolyticus]|nr:DUF3265 domain-containing protein [Vibrio parahaemolyticus]
MTFLVCGGFDVEVQSSCLVIACFTP